MPHSSGGGSHSSGSHSGSFGGSHGSSSANSVRSSYFSGCLHRYVYYKNKKPQYLYTNQSYASLTAKSSVTSKIFYSLFLIPFIIFGIFALGAFRKAPEAIKPAANASVMVEDNLGVINNKTALMNTLTEFKKLTGITPCVVTVHHEDWKGTYTSMERYAYNLYLEKFKDEKHWLIVYSEAEVIRDFNDWSWEGMQGDDTDSVLSESKAERFTNELQKNLLREQLTVGEAIEGTFHDALGYMMEMEKASGSVGFGIVWMLFIGFFYFMIWYDPNARKYRKVVEIPMATNKEEEKAMEILCAYCGGIYLKNSLHSCPHCGAVETRKE